MAGGAAVSMPFGVVAVGRCHAVGTNFFMRARGGGQTFVYKKESRGAEALSNLSAYRYNVDLRTGTAAELGCVGRRWAIYDLRKGIYDLHQ